MMRSRTLCLALLLGWAAVPALAQDRKGTQQTTQSADEGRVEALRRNYEAILKGQDVHVSIVLRNATVQEGVEQFRKQVVGWDFIFDATNVPEDFRVDEFIVRDKVWRDAFDAFTAKAGLMVDEERPGIIRFSKPARLTLNMKDAEIKAVVDLVARISRANIILSDKVSGTVSLSVNDVPWNAVLEYVIKTLGPYTIVRERFDILRIVHVDELKRQMETKLYQFKFILPPPSYRAKVQDGKQFTGKPLPPAATVDEIQKQFTLLTMFKSMLTKGSSADTSGRIDYDKENNAILITDTKVILDRIEGILKILDVEPEQVIVDVKFVSTTNEDLLNFGMNYTLGDDEGVSLGVKALPPLPSYGGYPVGTLPAGSAHQVSRLPFGIGRELSTTDQFFLTTYDMTATLRAFRRDRFSKLIQEPTLSVLDNTEATLFVGEEVPYAESRASTSQLGSLEFSIAEGGRSPVKIGFTLLIIPRVLREQNKVVLTVIPQNEQLTGRSSTLVPGFDHFEIGGLGGGAGDPLSIELPRLAQTTLVTRLMVDNGRTVVLGGLVTERITYEDKKIPFLGDIPLINFLFKQRNDTTTREHLLIFVTPRIVKGARFAEENLRKQLRELEELERQRLEDMRLKRATEELRRQDQDRMRQAAEELKLQQEEMERQKRK